MTASKDVKAGIPGQAGKDALIEAGPGATAEISDAELDAVSGGAYVPFKLPTIGPSDTRKDSAPVPGRMDGYIKR
jgi:hypothetical protein